MESESKILIPIFIARLVIAGILLFLSIIQLSATTNAKKRLVLILNVFYILSMILYLLNPLEPLGCTYLLVTSHLPTLFGIIEITYLTELVLVAAKRIDRLYESTPDGHAKGLRVAGCLLVLLMLIQMITVGVTDTEAATLILEMAIIIYSLILVFYSVQAICNMRSSLRDLIVLMNATQQDMDFKTAQGIKKEFIPMLHVSVKRMSRQLAGIISLGVLAVVAQIFGISKTISSIAKGKNEYWWCANQNHYMRNSLTSSVFFFIWYLIPIYALSYVWIPITSALGKMCLGAAHMLALYKAEDGSVLERGGGSNTPPSRLPSLYVQSLSFEGKRSSVQSKGYSGRKSKGGMATLFEAKAENNRNKVISNSALEFKETHNRSSSNSRRSSRNSNIRRVRLASTQVGLRGTMKPSLNNGLSLSISTPSPLSGPRPATTGRAKKGSIRQRMMMVKARSNVKGNETARSDSIGMHNDSRFQSPPPIHELIDVHVVKHSLRYANHPQSNSLAIMKNDQKLEQAVQKQNLYPFPISSQVIGISKLDTAHSNIKSHQSSTRHIHSQSTVSQVIRMSEPKAAHLNGKICHDAIELDSECTEDVVNPPDFANGKFRKAIASKTKTIDMEAGRDK